LYVIVQSKDAGGNSHKVPMLEAVKAITPEIPSSSALYRQEQ